MTRTLDTFAVLGAGNGGQTTAADLTLQGRRVRLFEFPEYAGGLQRLRETRRFTARGAVSGTGTLELVTTDLAEALEGADAVMVCTQATTLERVAAALAPLIRADQVVVLNPGSTGGSLRLARHFRRVGMDVLPDLLEFGTLTYGCRADDGDIHCPVKVSRVLYGALPAPALEPWAGDLESLFPGLVRARDAFEAGLTNANPVIHPPITLLNGARFENEGADMFFYRDGVSPTVARLIRALDEERMALMAALGYEPVPDPRNSHLQGYAASDDYFEAYAHGPGFAAFRSPDTLDHRYVHEDMGLGLVLYSKLGEVLGVETPASRAFVAMGSIISGIDYMSENGDVLARLGLDGLDRDGIVTYLATGTR